MSDDTTRMSGPAGGPTSGSGWLSSSGSVDHGRFALGTMLDNRYRVLGLLGRGGMGEVYRADDLRLGQQVALKFLPEALTIDARRLAQFHNEVRTARQVSHPNVCRVYDIGEIKTGSDQTLLFLTMEYVDGEDLSVLLRRIGRLPEERAIEIARQICGGLAAAHERGILHRDLKPANIMLDGAGKVRIMDFSLAAIGQVDDVRAGTPAYMAPEQLSGLEVTVRSDIYGLGLVLYEVFTGRRAFDAKTIADLVAQHQSGSITSPSQLVSSLDDAVDRAIMRCLESEPARRPSSALAVAAALPGGDPLAAALAAGETPSPEMVAAAGGQGATLSLAAGVAWMLAISVVVFLCVRIADRASLLARVPLTKSIDVLTDRAGELQKSLGYSNPAVDTRRGFTYDEAYLKWISDHDTKADRWGALSTGRPPALLFWYRSSPVMLVPRSPLSSVTPTDPAVVINGMTIVTLDSSGRLVRFQAAPPHQEPPATATPVLVDWDKLFVAAELERATFAEAVPIRTPPAYADERRAWQGTLPGTTVPVRIEAAGYRGRVTSFEIVEPWTTALRDTTTTARANSNNPIFIMLLLGGIAVAARANLGSGRADRRGAFRTGTFMFFVIMAAWLVDIHVGEATNEQQRFFSVTGIALFLGAIMYLVYLALEPFVRRSSPAVLIGWSRVLAGRLRDPLVGRDLVLGTAAGAVLALLTLAVAVVPTWFGRPEPVPQLDQTGALEGARMFLGDVFQVTNVALQNALITVFEWVAFRVIVEWIWTRGVRRLRPSIGTLPEIWIAVLAVLLASAVTFIDAEPGDRGLNTVFQLLTVSVTLAVILRVGMFGTLIAFFVSTLLTVLPITFDGARLYAAGSWTVVGLTLGMAALGFWMARSGDQISKRFERVR